MREVLGADARVHPLFTRRFNLIWSSQLVHLSDIWVSVCR